MPTSLHDLLDALNTHLSATGPSFERRADAAQALGPLGRALHRLADDGLSHEVGGYRERFVHELARACPANTTRTDPADERLSMLSGAIADTVQILRPELRIASRWAIALELAATARRLADTAAEGADAEPLAPYVHLLGACVLVERTGAIEPPSAQDAQLLDRAIPAPLSQAPGTAAERITEAMAGLIHHTRPGTSLSIAEALAVCIAAETLCATAANLPDREQSEAGDLKSAAHAWRQVRTELHPFNDGSRHRHEQRPTAVAWAIRLHDTLRQTTFVAPAPQDHTRTSEPNVSDAVSACIAQLPELGQHLCELIQQWPATGQVLAYAQQLPHREDRLAQRLADQRAAGLVHADATDLAPVLQAVRNAMSTVRSPHQPSTTESDAFSARPAPEQRHEISRNRLSDWGSLEHREPQRPSSAGHSLAVGGRPMRLPPP
jgi:hypothetical protein